MAFNINVFFIFFVVFISSFEKLKTISNIWFVCNSARESCTLALASVFLPMSQSLRFDWYSRHFVLRIVCSFFVLFDFPQWWNRSLLLVKVKSSCLHLWLRYDTSIEFRAFMQPILYLAQCADKYNKKHTKLCWINRQQLSSAFDCERSGVYECACSCCTQVRTKN